MENENNDLKDWEQNPHLYLTDSEGNFILKKDGTPRKKGGRPQGTKSNYRYSDEQKAKMAARRAVSKKKKAIEKDIYLEDEVINLIASCVKTNVRELEGNLVKLGAYSDLMKVDIDLEIAKKQLKLNEDYDQKIITIESLN